MKSWLILPECMCCPLYTYINTGIMFMQSILFMHNQVNHFYHEMKDKVCVNNLQKLHISHSVFLQKVVGYKFEYFLYSQPRTRLCLSYLYPSCLIIAKIILLGIISIVCIARTSGKTESVSWTTMMSRGVLSWAWSGSWDSLFGVPWSLRSVPEVLMWPWEGEDTGWVAHNL